MNHEEPTFEDPPRMEEPTKPEPSMDELLARVDQSLDRVTKLAQDVKPKVQATREENAQLKNRNSELEKENVIDHLTRVYNRRFFDAQLTKEFTRSTRKTLTDPFKPVHGPAVLLVDIDHFKMVNDTRGHDWGDKALQEVASIMQSLVRPQDYVCRYGGEEFSIILTEVDTKYARDIAERIREQIAKQTVLDLKQKITVSIGVAGYEPKLNQERLVTRADEALYEAKDEGRDRVVVFQKTSNQSEKE